MRSLAGLACIGRIQRRHALKTYWSKNGGEHRRNRRFVIRFVHTVYKVQKYSYENRETQQVGVYFRSVTVLQPWIDEVLTYVTEVILERTASGAPCRFSLLFGKFQTTCFAKAVTLFPFIVSTHIHARLQKDRFLFLTIPISSYARSLSETPEAAVST